MLMPAEANYIPHRLFSARRDAWSGAMRLVEDGRLLVLGDKAKPGYGPRVWARRACRQLQVQATHRFGPVLMWMLASAR